MNTNRIIAWTDGSCHNKTGDKGGYGVVMKFYDADGCETGLSYCGGQYHTTTSARMEIRGVLSALRKCPKHHKITIHCDNKYVVNAIKERWMFAWEHQDWVNASTESGLRNNRDLWKKVIAEYRRLDGKNNLDIRWVRGHNGNENNEKADQLAHKGAHRAKKILDLSLIHI
jgi:ribonuclease HI